MTNKLEIPDCIMIEEIGRLVREGKTVSFRTTGNSMRPFITGGSDSVTVAAVNEIRKGDILLCRISEKKYVLHRMIKNENGTITLMGDGNLSGTEKCSRRNVIGKAVMIIKASGKRIDCCSVKMRMFAWLWFKLLPLRKYLLYIDLKIFLKTERHENKKGICNA